MGIRVENRVGFNGEVRRVRVGLKVGFRVGFRVGLTVGLEWGLGWGSMVR